VTRSSVRPGATSARPDAAPLADRPPARRRGWAGFVQRYGWRAYALPVLALVTVFALIHTGSPAAVRRAVDRAADRPGSAAPPDAAAVSQLKVDDPGNSAVSGALGSTQLPPGAPYSSAGTGTFTVLRGSSPVIGRGHLYRFDIEVENGVKGVDLNNFAAVVMSSLSDHRSWTATGKLALKRVSSGPVDFSIALTSTMTVRRLCGYDLPLETSCYDGAHTLVVLNVARWVRGAAVYASDLATYRVYAVNHEVGHAIGHNHAHQCLRSGLAPVMMQQTIGAKTATGQICQANPWPYPPGAPDAPGAEQAGDGPDMSFYQRNAG